MTAPGNDVLYLAFTLTVFVSSGYAVGRIHQWHRHGVERDEAYRGGYDKASDSIIGIVRSRNRSGPGPDGAPAPACAHKAPFNQRQAYPVRRGKAGHVRLLRSQGRSAVGDR